MRLLALLFDPRGRIAQRPYLIAGLTLLAVKIAVDIAICAALGLTWSPFLYFAPIILATPGLATTQAALPLIVLLAGALPFAWAGIALTLKRLRDAGSPLWLTVLFMLPVLNWCLMLIGCLAPTARATRPEPVEVDEPDRPYADEEPAPAVRRSPGETIPGSRPPAPRRERRVAVFVPVLVAVLVAALAVLLSASLWGSYGAGLFIATPFMVGYVSVALAHTGPGRPPTLGRSLRVACVAGACSAGALLVFGLEGAFCVLMALPLTVPLALIGGAVAHAVMADNPHTDREIRRSACVMPLLIPALVAVEHVAPPEPPVYPVVTSVIVAADPATVWRHVIAFPPLAEPDELLFRGGIAYPTSATIDGVGVGAIRRCVFSTGPFIEPITVWDEGRELAFDVSECPEPMTEWSPWPIHPRHLHGYMVSRHGRFLLEALPDGRTRLEGTTWYRHGLWPDTYWRWWSDAIVHRIHRRVLEHVRALSERDAAG